MTITDVAPPPEQHRPPDRRTQLRSDFRALRSMLVVIGAIVVAAVVAIIVAAVAYAPSHPLTVTATDYRIEMPATMHAGTYHLSFVNRGVQGHEILIFRTALPAGSLPVDASGNVVEDAPVLHNVLDSGDALAPGKTQALKVSLTPGHYAVVCNLPAHYRLGMWRDLTVQ